MPLKKEPKKAIFHSSGQGKKAKGVWHAKNKKGKYHK